MSERRKKALVYYLAALFGVAFCIVCISLGIQMKKNTLNATTADKVVALQEELHQLSADNQSLNAKNQELEAQLDEIIEGFEYLEGTAYEATNRINQLQRVNQLYALVTGYQQAQLSGNAQAQLLYLSQLAEAQTEAKALDETLYQTIQTILTEYQTKE